MTKDKALKLAIEAFENYRFELRHEIINACKEALEQPAQEPVGVVSWHEGTVMGSIFPSSNMPKDGDKLYTHPKEWQGLSDYEIEEAFVHTLPYEYGRAIEAKLKEKNNE